MKDNELQFDRSCHALYSKACKKQIRSKIALHYPEARRDTAETAKEKENVIVKLLVFGAGVLGCNLANNLFRAGKDVTLLARDPWAEEIRSNGLRIKNTLSRRTAVNRIPVAEELSPEDAYDVIFVAVRYTQIETILETLRASRAKTIIFVGNNVRASETAAYLPEKNVLFAFTSAAGHRESNYVDSVDLCKITVGPLRGAPSQEKLIQEIFAGTKYKVTYEPNMGDYLLCHAAFVLPAVFACYKTDGNLKKLKKDNAYLNRLIDANIEGYRAIRNAGHEILPDADKEFEGAAYRKTCFRFFKLMCATVLGKICASDHAMNAVDEMRALNRDIKTFFDAVDAEYPVWQALQTFHGYVERRAWRLKKIFVRLLHIPGLYRKVPAIFAEQTSKLFGTDDNLCGRLQV